MQLVLDMSETCATSTDMAPNRAVALIALAKTFITEFFDENPLSQMRVLVLRHGTAQALTEFSASPVTHKRAFEGAIDTGGAVSLQNMLDQCCQVRTSRNMQTTRYLAIYMRMVQCILLSMLCKHRQWHNSRRFVAYFPSYGANDAKHGLHVSDQTPQVLTVASNVEVLYAGCTAGAPVRQ
jgi:Ssl1-like